MNYSKKHKKINIKKNALEFFIKYRKSMIDVDFPTWKFIVECRGRADWDKIKGARI